MKTGAPHLLLVLACVWGLSCCSMSGAAAPEESEIERLSNSLPGFRIIRAEAKPGTLILDPGQGFTIENLRKVKLQDDPPELGARSAEFSQKLGIGSNGPATYVARAISPFRFNRFDCEFHYDGPHQGNWMTYEYASLHGFNRLGGYYPNPVEWTHLPARTDWVLMSSHAWDGWMTAHGYKDLRWDKLAEAAAAGEELIAPGHFKPRPGFGMILIDQEFGGLLPAEELRKQPWYPADADAAGKAAFEDKYYLGYTICYSEPAKAAHRDGWKTVGIYAWQSFKNSWYNLDPRIDLSLSVPWAKRFMDMIYDSYDVIYVDGYCDDWSSRNVAFTLGAVEQGLEYAKSRPTQKPVRAYLSTVILNNPGIGRVLRMQPLPSEEIRAMFALQFFTGADGLVQWNFTDKEDHRLPPRLLPADDKDIWVQWPVQVGSEFKAKRKDNGRKELFRRYDFIHAVETNSAGVVTFHRVKPMRMPEDLETGPLYSMKYDELLRHLRPTEDSVAAMVEGLALVKPFENLLRDGTPVIDVPARKLYDEKLPIVRRVKVAGLNIIAAYDPDRVYGGSARNVRLDDFDGMEGFTVDIPTDSEIRLFFLKTGREAGGE